MQTIQVGEMKSNFSEILKQIQDNHEKFIIEFGRKHKKVAMLVPYEEPKKTKRKFGQLEGKKSIDVNFDDELDEINDMFYPKN